MRLLCLTNLFPDRQQPWRGLDNVTLLHAMRKERPDADIRVLCLRPGHGFWLRQPAPLQPRAGDEALHPSYHWAPYLPKLGGWNHHLFALGVKRALRALPPAWQPQALLVPWLFPDACGVSKVAGLSHLPLVAIAQGSDVHQYLNVPARRKAILALCRKAQVLTRSDDLRQRLLQAAAPEGNITTVYNGVDLQTFHPGDKRTAREQLSLPLDAQVLLFVGNFLPVKGLDLLIEATARLRRERKVHLVLIGSGPLEEALRKQATAAGLTAQDLTFAGRKGPEEVAHYMRAADAVCLTSQLEGVPNVLLEAFASGRPLVSTQVGGIHEITSPSPRGGFLIPGRDSRIYAQALSQALDHPPDELALNNYASAFSWPRCAGRVWSQIDKILPQSR